MKILENQNLILELKNKEFAKTMIKINLKEINRN